MNNRPIPEYDRIVGSSLHHPVIGDGRHSLHEIRPASDLSPDGMLRRELDI